MAKFEDEHIFNDRNKSKHTVIPSCPICSLNGGNEVDSPIGKVDVLFIGDYPSPVEAVRGTTHVSALYKLIKEEMVNTDLTWDLVNAVKCYNGEVNYKGRIELKNSFEDIRKPIKHCDSYLIKKIKKSKAKVLVPMGKYALEALFGKHIKRQIETIETWRGFAFPDRNWGKWIVPTYNNRDIEFHGYENEFGEFVGPIQTIFKQDISKAIEVARTPFPKFTNEENEVNILKEIKDVKKALRRWIDRVPPFLSFDYETTGLKPHHKDHRIVCVGISDGKKTIAFELHDRCKPDFIELLVDPRIRKIAANIKFEEAWTRAKLNVRVASWFYDTVLGAHCLDNRNGITGVKFQTYLHFGRLDYDSHIKPFLASKEKNANAFNTIEKANRHDLLLYCGLDALFEYRIAEKQTKEFSHGFLSNKL